MVRVTMEHFEEAVPMLARNDEQMTALTVGILRYSRNLAFAAASGYADAAEARGAWDTRMEANVVDAVVRGDVGPELQSQAAALNWDATAPATVIVGLPRPDRARLHQRGRPRDRQSQRPRRAVRRARHLAGGDRVGPAVPHGPLPRRIARGLRRRPVVIGPVASSLSAAHYSATEAIAGMNAVAGWSGAPRPVAARELLPERALLGDSTAIAALEADVMRPLAEAGPALAETLDAYLDSGGAIEACARKLFVHPNTVRYRLKRIADFTGRDPTVPRDAYVLRVATTVGRFGRQVSHSNTPNGTVAQVTRSATRAFGTAQLG